MKYVVSMARRDERGVPRDRLGPSISPRLPVPSVLVNMPNRQLRDLSDNMSALATCNRRETRLLYQRYLFWSDFPKGLPSKTYRGELLAWCLD